MGRHSVTEEPAPVPKPRYRFLIAFLGIFALGFATLAIVANVFPHQAPPAEAGEGTPFPGAPRPGPTGGGPDPTAPDGQVLGTYAVAQSWPDGFIGTVQLSNPGPAQLWQVTLAFPAGVGALQQSWLADGPGTPAVTRSGQTLTFTADRPLAAGAHIGLNFQLGKASGDFAPTSCVVNGRSCS